METCHNSLQEEKKEVESIMKERSHSLASTNVTGSNQMKDLTVVWNYDKHNPNVSGAATEPQSVDHSAIEGAAGISGLASKYMQHQTSDKPNETKFARVRHYLNTRVLLHTHIHMLQ